jgi:DNA-directed RNA polymerase subunit RPC12/RpoP
MALFLLHARYGRTCNICGDRWLVTRRQAKGSPGRAPRPRRMSGPRTAQTYDIGRSAAAFDAAVEIWQAYRRCPYCGIDDFSQEPVRRAPGD